MELKKNVDLMLQVREQITSNPETHDQDTWITKSECGTTACIAGWAVLFSSDESKLTWTTDVVGDEHCLFVTERYIKHVARDALGLTTWEAENLFFANPDYALTLLDRYIEEGKNSA